MTENVQVLLPDEIWTKIFYFAFVGHKRIDTKTLIKCRRVSKGWSEMIKTNVWLSPSKEWGVITKAMINRTWFRVYGIFPVVDAGSLYPSHQMISHAKALETRGILPTGVMEIVAERVRKIIIEINRLHILADDIALLTCAASFAHLGLLGPVKEMWLSNAHRKDGVNVNLVSVPDQHLAALVSCVTDQVEIGNIRGCDLVTILERVNSSRLEISCQLGSDETRALVQAMETRVQEVKMRYIGDIESLMKYNGQGKCEWLSASWRMREDITAEDMGKLRKWAKRNNWGKWTDDNKRFVFSRTHELE